MIIENRESMAFTDTINAGESKTLSFKIQKQGRVKRVKLQIPDGPDGTLKVYPYYLDSKGIPKEIINFVGSEKNLSGNNVDIDLFTDTPIEAYSELKVLAKNEGGYPYPLQCFIEVEYIEIVGGYK